jgi:hypothetical protein
MRECRTYGSVRGTCSNARPYRDLRVSMEKSLHVLAYNLKRVIAILDVVPLMAAIRA